MTKKKKRRNCEEGKEKKKIRRKEKKKKKAVDMQKDRMLWESTQDRQHSQKKIYIYGVFTEE